MIHITTLYPLLGLSLAMFFGPSGTASGAKAEGRPIIASELGALDYFGPGNRESVLRIVPVAGKPFAEALQVNTMDLEIPADSHQGLSALVSAPLIQGDLIWISFEARCLETKRERGEASFELRFDRLVDGQYTWPPYLERGVSVGREWTEVSVPCLIGKEVGPNGMRLMMSFDSYSQRFELGPITFINCGSEEFMADYMRDFMSAVFSNPRVVGFVQWGFWGKSHWIPRAAMWNGDWSIRKHGQVFVDMVTKTWRTDADGLTDAKGSFTTRGFNGDYEVTVTRSGRSQTQFLTLGPGVGIQTISLP